MLQHHLIVPLQRIHHLAGRIKAKEEEIMRDTTDAPYYVYTLADPDGREASYQYWRLVPECDCAIPADQVS